MLPPSAEATGGSKSHRPRFEVADVFREYGPAYRRKHPLPLQHLKVMHAIEGCRTAALGGHLRQCDSCGFETNAYNSCRNRHCPKCQTMTKVKWLEKRKAELLPVSYYHGVFTIIHELNPLVLCNKKVIFNILFRSARETLQQFGADPKHGLGGKIGITGVLHTWNQKLLDHFHLHCLVPAGALAFDGSHWTHARKNFLFPVKALSKVFRGKFIDYLKNAFAQQKLIFPGNISHLGTDEGFSDLIKQLWRKDWIVYCKAPFNGPEHVLNYLGRYTHRVAISNHRITGIRNGIVTFRYRDRTDGDKSKQMSLPAEEFIRRFLLHVLPNAYMRIRHFGILANRCKKQDLPTCRKLLGLSPEMPTVQEKNTREQMIEVTGIDINVCPCCKNGIMMTVEELPRRRPPGIDSS